ncbi:MAG TPA: STAS domain-containing protein [Candidatus Acidoferrum sp.]|nr:STAS domain-containing protein [Candidatus Acidoferrum sp.]
MSISTNVRQVGAVSIVDITGNIVFGEESAALHDLVSGLLKNGQKQILLNLAGVNFIDSMGMGSLVSASTSVRKQGGELKLLNLSHKVSDVMQMTRLYTVFDVLNDEAVAVKSFGPSVAAANS